MSQMSAYAGDHSAKPQCYDLSPVQAIRHGAYFNFMRTTNSSPRKHVVAPNIPIGLEIYLDVQVKGK
jgi:hypothetical protein